MFSRFFLLPECLPKVWVSGKKRTKSAQMGIFECKSIDIPERWCIKMANIRENRKNNKIISYRFAVCLERDAQGKQVRRIKRYAIPALLWA